MIFTDEHINELKTFDFYKVDVLDAMNKGIETVKAWGDYREKIPFVSFVLTTCKRADMLKHTIQSILRQEFQDYEIVIVDNECADIQEDTATQRLVREFNDSRIIYFRNLSPTVSRMDRGASLARGEWICFCHDDDIFDARHLKVMTSIVRAHEEINFLGCTHREFQTKEMQLLQHNGYIANNFPDGICLNVDFTDSIFFHNTHWLGGLIKRKLYVAMGGMPQIECGCGDCIMINKFMYLYSGYYLLKIPKYFYRKHGRQISSSSDNWFNTYLAEYIFYKYGLNKFGNVSNLDMNLLSNYKIHKKIYTTVGDEPWKFKWDMDLFREKSGIAFDGLDNEEAVDCYNRWEKYRQMRDEENMSRSFYVSVDEVATRPYSI